MNDPTMRTWACAAMLGLVAWLEFVLLVFAWRRIRDAQRVANELYSDFVIKVGTPTQREVTWRDIASENGRLYIEMRQIADDLRDERDVAIRELNRQLEEDQPDDGKVST